MSTQFKKILTIAASTLMLAGLGVSVTDSINPTTIYAAKHHKKKHHQHTTKKTGFAAEQKVGNWYVNNAKKLYSQFNNQGTFGQGQWSASGTPVMKLNLYKDKQYREGWIITYANGLNMNTIPDVSTGGTNVTYGQANKLYQDGVKLIESQHSKYNPKLINGTWTTDYQRSINDDSNN